MEHRDRISLRALTSITPTACNQVKGKTLFETTLRIKIADPDDARRNLHWRGALLFCALFAIGSLTTGCFEDLVATLDFECADRSECASGYTCAADPSRGSGAWCVPLTQITSSGGEDTTLSSSSGGDVLDGDDTSDAQNNPPTLCESDHNSAQGGLYKCIKAGTFNMGAVPGDDVAYSSEKPQHPVTLTRDFYFKATEVTQREWQAMFNNNPIVNDPDGVACEDCPVARVDWFEAAAYCNALSEAEALTPCFDLSSCTGSPGVWVPQIGRDDPRDEGYECSGLIVMDLNCEGYRLPTEAEWEYVGRAGTETIYFCGDDASCLDGTASYGDNTSTQPVAAQDANAWGVYDMNGNVMEWLWDWADLDFYENSPTHDPMGPVISGDAKMGRGGSYSTAAERLRASYRVNNNYSLSHRSVDQGFRCVRSALE